MRIRLLRTSKLYTIVKAVVALFTIVFIVKIFSNRKPTVLNSHLHEVNSNNPFDHQTKSPQDSLCVLPILEEPLPPANNNDNYKVKCNYNASIGITIESGKLIIRDQVTKCFYNLVKRVDDFETVVENEKISIRHGDAIPSDHFVVSCESENNIREQLPLLGIKAKLDLVKATVSSKTESNNGSLGYNVVFFGFDSVSRLAFKRYLPKSYDYFLNKLNGVVLKKHNVLGDGTTVNLLGILTGYKETELHEARKSHFNAKPVDDFPWIFKEFKKAGYVTQYGEDDHYYGAFQYRLLGFANPPTDHYARPFMVKFPNQNKCSGPTPRHLLLFNYLREFYKVYNDNRVKKFSFIFHVESSHNVQSDLLAVDRDLVDLLKQFQPGGLFGESILFLFGDHGARFSDHRASMQGKYEERLPFFGVHLPESLKTKQPQYLHNLRWNSEYLTSHLDVHATLLHILGHKPLSMNYAKRSHNLFEKITTPRSCNQLSIEPHWCVCSNWRNVSPQHPNVIKAANAAVDFFNNIIAQNAMTSMCVKHQLFNVTDAEMSQSNNALLAFKKSADNDGYIADLSDNMNTTEELYRITFSTLPSMALFEVTGHLNLMDNKFTFYEKEISRINSYANWIKCLKKNYPHLNMYCVCRDAL